MQIGPGKRVLYSAIVFAVALLSLEVVLSAVYFHVNGSSFATGEAIKEPQRIASIGEGLAAFDSLTAEQGIDAVNWDSLVRNYNVEQETLYAGAALYVDHVHLSPLGNRLLAEAILEKLRRLREPGIVSTLAE
ncbi:MAG: hypothetical protein WD489_06565 [Rhodovibrionaceae bacterium]